MPGAAREPAVLHPCVPLASAGPPAPPESRSCRSGCPSTSCRAAGYTRKSDRSGKQIGVNCVRVRRNNGILFSSLLFVVFISFKIKVSHLQRKAKAPQSNATQCTPQKHCTKAGKFENMVTIKTTRKTCASHQPPPPPTHRHIASFRPN